jgi:hypothetical protein
MRLVDLLGRLSEPELRALAERFHVPLDPGKRLGPAEQLARGITPHPSMATLPEWPLELRAGAERLAVEPMGLPRRELGGAAIRLVEAGLAFAVSWDELSGGAGAPEPGGDGSRVVMPGAIRLAVPASARDRLRSARSLLAQPQDADVVHALATTHETRPSAAPDLLRLEAVLLHLEDPGWVATVLETLPAAERRILDAVDARGGVLSIGEVLALEGAPARYATSQGAVLPRRSTAFELVRRGFLLPQGIDALVVPEEVGALVGVVRREAASRARSRVLDEATLSDLAPARARRSPDPGPRAAAALLVLRREGVDLDARRGIPKTPLRRAARAAGLPVPETELLVSLARGGQLQSSPVRLGDLGRRLFLGWLRGSAWDEARRSRDRFRAGEKVGRIPTPTMGLRDALVDLLGELPPGRFVRREAVLRAGLRDLRSLASPVLLEQARRRGGEAAFASAADEILAVILDESLPALGAVDHGDAGEDGLVLRPTSRLQRWAGDLGEAGAPPEAPATPASGAPSATRSETGAGGEGPWRSPPARSRRSSGRPPAPPRAAEDEAAPVLLTVPPDAPLRRLLALGAAVSPFVNPDEDTLVLEMTRSSLAQALDAGETPETLLPVLAEVAGAPVPERLERLIVALHQDRTPAVWVSAAAFLRVDAPELREALLREEGALFDPDSPPEGLLVRPGITRHRVRRALDRRGGRLVSDPHSSTPSKRVSRNPS